ncbi:hypothetical protein CU633_21840 [Bacillus sp. V3-13]|uniref:hypothetical protein n=1 Tax=Bacillus sp. V3-13 TaxID=2053728 RepID=UPI000C764934|nr:hypothetical protein [Bacillus sp. V3-13]PLR75297.1 hypothetical protein CU633_21840 [Bacillus sp. V3-13]
MSKLHQEQQNRTEKIRKLMMIDWTEDEESVLDHAWTAIDMILYNAEKTKQEDKIMALPELSGNLKRLLQQMASIGCWKMGLGVKIMILNDFKTINLSLAKMLSSKSVG